MARRSRALVVSSSTRYALLHQTLHQLAYHNDCLRMAIKSLHHTQTPPELHSSRLALKRPAPPSRRTSSSSLCDDNMQPPSAVMVTPTKEKSSFAFSTPIPQLKQARKTLSMDFSTLRPPMSSPFTNIHPAPNPSVHLLHKVAHPLSQVMSTDSPLSSPKVLNNKTNIHMHSPAIHLRVNTDVEEAKTPISNSSSLHAFHTPQNYKLVRPSQAAFMSTGLLSKRSRPRLPEITHLHAPDTPCKKPVFSFIPDQQLFPNMQDVSPTPTRTSNSSPLSKKLRSASIQGDGSDLEANGESTPMDECVPSSSASSSVDPSPSPSIVHSPGVPSHMSPTGELITTPENPHSHLHLTTTRLNLFHEMFDSKYEILETLGSGEFSEAYKVRHRQTGTVSAVKRTKYPFVGNRDRLRRMEEVEILRHLGKHDQCLHLEGAWEEKGHLYIRTELCENGTLALFLDEMVHRVGNVAIHQVWRIFGEICIGLQYIHACDVLHLDLKPANIFIGNDGKLKIGDFGLAVRLPIERGLEREGDREYIAPEILERAFYSKAADVFSLGLILLEIACNIVLPDNGPEWQKLRMGDLSDVPMDEESQLGNNPELKELVLWMIQRDPCMRPSIDEVCMTPCTRVAIEDIQRGDHALRGVVNSTEDGSNNGAGPISQ